MVLTRFVVIIALPKVITLLAVKALDKYELNDCPRGELDSRDMKNGFALIIAGYKLLTGSHHEYCLGDIPFHDRRVAAPSIKYTQRIRMSLRTSCGREVLMTVWSLILSSCPTSSVEMRYMPPTSEPVAVARMVISKRNSLRSLCQTMLQARSPVM